MGKGSFWICKNKGADQLRGYYAADQRLCFRYTRRSTMPLLPKFEIKPEAILCGCTAQIMSVVVGNPKDRFSHDMAQTYLGKHCGPRS